MVKKRFHVRAVMGGAGNLIGARGQTSNARIDDATYSHRTELVE